MLSYDEWQLSEHKVDIVFECCLRSVISAPLKYVNVARFGNKVIKTGMRKGEENISGHEAENRKNRKGKSSNPAHPPQLAVMPEWG